MNFIICPIEAVDLPYNRMHVNHPINLEHVTTFKKTICSPSESDQHNKAALEFHFENDIEKWMFESVEQRDTIYRFILTRIKRTEDVL